MNSVLWPLATEKPKFFGSYEHALDPKGRLTLPAKFRAHFGDRCYLTRSQFGDPCVVVWTPDDFERTTNEIHADSWADPRQRRTLRSMARDTYEVEIDRMGRMPIPSNLRVVASLTREVLIQGAYQTIELWEPAHWRAYDEADEPTMPPTDADGRNG